MTAITLDTVAERLEYGNDATPVDSRQKPDIEAWHELGTEAVDVSDGLKDDPTATAWMLAGNVLELGSTRCVAK